jgi:hypothetical protein
MPKLPRPQAQRIPTWMRVVFAIVVLGAGAAGAVLAIRAAVPAPVPDWALRSKSIYRLEIFLAAFIAFYAPLAVLFLAAQGRAFTKFSAGQASIEAEELGQVGDATDSNKNALANVQKLLRRLAAQLQEHEARLNAAGVAPINREHSEKRADSDADEA